MSDRLTFGPDPLVGIPNRHELIVAHGVPDSAVEKLDGHNVAQMPDILGITAQGSAMAEFPNLLALGASPQKILWRDCYPVCKQDASKLKMPGAKPTRRSESAAVAGSGANAPRYSRKKLRRPGNLKRSM